MTIYKMAVVIKMFHLILLLGFISAGLSALVAITMSINHENDTCVELSCGFISDVNVAAGLYMKGKSKSSFARTIALGGDATNCQITPLPANIQCECVNKSYFICKMCAITVENDEEEWKCAIPNNGIAVFSNTVKIIVPGATRESEHQKVLHENVGKTETKTSETVSWRPAGPHDTFDKELAVIFGIIICTFLLTVYLLMNRMYWTQAKDVGQTSIFVSAETQYHQPEEVLLMKSFKSTIRNL